MRRHFAIDKFLSQSQILKNGISSFLVWIMGEDGYLQNGRGSLWDGLDKADKSLSRKKKKWFRKKTYSHLGMLGNVLHFEGKSLSRKWGCKKGRCTSIYFCHKIKNQTVGVPESSVG